LVFLKLRWDLPGKWTFRKEPVSVFATVMRNVQYRGSGLLNEQESGGIIYAGAVVLQDTINPALQ
jgi:hypothetical protein